MPVFKPIIQPFFLFLVINSDTFICIYNLPRNSHFLWKKVGNWKPLFFHLDHAMRSHFCVLQRAISLHFWFKISYYKINNEHSLLCQIHFWTILFHFLVVKKGKVWVNKCEYAWGRKIDTFFSPEWVNRLFAEWPDLK